MFSLKVFVAYGDEKYPKIKIACGANRSAQNKTRAAKLAAHFKIRVVESHNTPSPRVAHMHHFAVNVALARSTTPKMRPDADDQVPGTGIYFTTLGISSEGRPSHTPIQQQFVLEYCYLWTAYTAAATYGVPRPSRQTAQQ